MVLQGPFVVVLPYYFQSAVIEIEHALQRNLCVNAHVKIKKYIKRKNSDVFFVLHGLPKQKMRTTMWSIPACVHVLAGNFVLVGKSSEKLVFDWHAHWLIVERAASNMILWAHKRKMLMRNSPVSFVRILKLLSEASVFC